MRIVEREWRMAAPNRNFIGNDIVTEQASGELARVSLSSDYDGRRRGRSQGVGPSDEGLATISARMRDKTRSTSSTFTGSLYERAKSK